MVGDGLSWSYVLSCRDSIFGLLSYRPGDQIFAIAPGKMRGAIDTVMLCRQTHIEQ
jgi:hypothetical protein